MVNSITHSISDFCFVAFVEPCSEGAARINRAIAGVNLHNIHHPKLDWTQRLIDVTVGISLLFLPLINGIILICMRTFGSNIPLSTNGATSIEEPWEEAIAEANVELTPEAEEIVEADEAIKVEITKHKSLVTEGGKVIEMTTEIEKHSNQISSISTAPGIRMESIHDLKWQLKSQRFANESLQTDLRLRRKDNTIKIYGTRDGKPFNKVLELSNPNLPWIQSFHGFHPFLSSPKTELVSYGVYPKNAEVYEFITKKIGNEDIPHYPQAIKTTSAMNTFGFDQIILLTSWYDKDTLELVKSSYCLSLFGVVFAEGGSERIYEEPPSPEAKKPDVIIPEIKKPEVIISADSSIL